MSIPERALSPVEESIPRFVLSVGEMQHRIQELQAFVKSQMVKDVDYGVIPGTKKPTLYKPGAEKLAAMYGFAQHSEVLTKVEDWDREFFHYEVRVELVNKRTGVIEAQGAGSANSRETRYRWRWVPEKDVPQGVDKATLTRRSGKFGPLYRMDNENPADVVNTCLKMAKKRALVDAVLAATRSSGLFTQDAEDFPDPEDVDAPTEPTERTRSKVHEAAARAAGKGDANAARRDPATAARRDEPPADREPVGTDADPRGFLRQQLGAHKITGSALGILLAPFKAVEVAALTHDQATTLVGVLAGLASKGEDAAREAVAQIGGDGR